MAALLPQGMFMNTTEVYEEIASYAVLPPEKLHQYWRVYATVARRIRDPTAYRQENFWRHVWGSHKRFLSGPRLARLFEDFANSPTFVPLRGPRNRYGNLPIPRPRPPQRAATACAQLPTAEGVQPSTTEGTQQPTFEGAQSSTTEGEASGQGSDGATNKSLVPSALRPTPSHTILKTPRRPSTMGTRPKARFASPLDEETNDGDSSAISTKLDSSEKIRHTIRGEAVNEGLYPAKTLADALPRGATLGQQKDMAKALGITTQVRLVEAMQGVAPPKKNLIQKMQPLNDPVATPPGATTKRGGKIPPMFASPAGAPPMPTDIQYMRQQQKTPPGADRRKPTEAGNGPQRTLPRRRSEHSSGIQPVAPRDLPVSAASEPGQRQRGANQGTAQATGSQEQAETRKTGHVVLGATDRSQLVTRRRVVPLPVSKRPRIVMPLRKLSRQNSAVSDSSTTSMKPSNHRMTPTQPAERPFIDSPGPNITTPSLGDGGGVPVHGRTVSLHTAEEALEWDGPPNEPSAWTAAEEGREWEEDPPNELSAWTAGSPMIKGRIGPLAAAPNPLPREEVQLPALDEFFITQSPAPRPEGRTNILPPPQVGPGPPRPGMPAKQPSSSSRSRSGMRPGTTSSIFPPSRLLVRASAKAAELSEMTASGEIGSENRPLVMGPAMLPGPAATGYPDRPSGSAPRQYQPTPPSTAPPIRFGRSRSQLKVLLEVDSDNGGPSKSKAKKPAKKD
ncbi:hypothetical protein QBC39DRAFT_2695 [Podospora conica]|nr:hypothetical protein QBC39DRAFT_2695 [Schizothecium conicum]